MKYTSQAFQASSLYRQKGFVFKLVHSLLIISVAMILVLLYQGGHLNFLHHLPGKIIRILEEDEHTISRGTNRNPEGSRYWQTDYRERDYQEQNSSWETNNTYYDDRETGRYVVQLIAAYDAPSLYHWRDELLQNGYKAYLDNTDTAKGVLFKLRIGPYRSRQQAEEARWRIRQYSPEFADGFIVPDG